ncbi:MAG: IS4 family transposase, partial [Pseudomonadales bacterium]|nr:IS4 family transposase [Pseudomonadales bacterium]
MFGNTSEWAVLTFGKCQLGDKRRTRRLIKMATNMADHIGSSVVKSCPDAAHVEGSYRLIRNDDVSAEAIAEGGFEATVELAQNYDELLALEDTTSLSYKHSVADDMGYTTSSLSNRTKGIFAHSVLLYAPKQEHTVGLIEQRRWIRNEESYGSRHHNQKRDYQTKESFKWELASEAVKDRLGGQMAKCISVCDRESDVIEYLVYKQQNQQRFVVRAKSNRPLCEGDRLYDHADTLMPAGKYTVNVPQKGGRSARKATMEIRYAPVSVLAPTRKQPLYPPITTYVVYCDEVTAEPDTPSLQWVLLTTEPVVSTEDALKIVNYYEARWQVELFHKVWKTEGTNVEALRMQDVENLERVAVIKAFIAIRLM